MVVLKNQWCLYCERVFYSLRSRRCVVVMPVKNVLLVNQDPSLVPLLAKYLERTDTKVTPLSHIKDSSKKTREDSFSFIIIEAQQGWTQAAKLLEGLHDNARHTYVIMAPSPLLKSTAGYIKEIYDEVVPLSSQKEEKNNNGPSIEGFVEGKLKFFVKKMKAGGGRNLYSLLIKEFEKPLITLALKETMGNQIKTAHLLGVNRNTLRKKIKELKIPVTRKEKS